MTEAANTVPSDADIASEIGDIFNAPAPEAEAQPTPTPSPQEPEPISAKDVAGEKAKPPTAPDSTALRDRMAAFRPKPPEEVDPREAELAQLREAVSQIAGVYKVAATGKTQAQLQEEQNSPQFLAQQAIEEARRAREESEQYAQRLAEYEKSQQQREIISDLAAFVETNKESYPLTHELKSVDLVYAFMDENPDLSETQAAAQVEESWLEIVERGAKLLGYVKSEQPGQASGTSETETPTLGPAGAGTAVPKGWETMSDDERDNELARQLGQALKGQPFNL